VSVDFPWEQITGEPLIYASMGTLLNGLADVFRTIIAARVHARAEAPHLTGPRLSDPTNSSTSAIRTGCRPQTSFVCHALKGCSFSYLLIHDFWLYLGLDSGKRLIQAATWNALKDVATLGLEGDKSRCARKFRDGVVLCLTSVQLRRYRKSVESRDPEGCNSGLV
jgi:hypothetical protein